MRERLAIAVPFHAGLDYLDEALASVRAQGDPEWSLTVVDDSGGESGARARVEALRDERVRYLANPANLGMVACWNRCLDLAGDGAELVTLLHADDRLLPDYVACVKRLAAAHPRAVALFTASVTLDAAGRRRFSLQDDIKRLLVPRGGPEVVLSGEAGLRALMRGNFVVCPTLAWRRARLADRRFEPRWRQVQDLELLARLLLEGEAFVGSREPAYAYRRHDQNATARQTASLLRFEEEFRIFDEIAARARARMAPGRAHLAPADHPASAPRLARRERARASAAVRGRAVPALLAGRRSFLADSPGAARRAGGGLELRALSPNDSRPAVRWRRWTPLPRRSPSACSSSAGEPSRAWRICARGSSVTSVEARPQSRAGKSGGCAGAIHGGHERRTRSGSRIRRRRGGRDHPRGRDARPRGRALSELEPLHLVRARTNR